MLLVHYLPPGADQFLKPSSVRSRYYSVSRLSSEMSEQEMETDSVEKEDDSGKEEMEKEEENSEESDSGSEDDEKDLAKITELESQVYRYRR